MDDLTKASEIIQSLKSLLRQIGDDKTKDTVIYALLESLHKIEYASKKEINFVDKSNRLIKEIEAVSKENNLQIEKAEKKIGDAINGISFDKLRDTLVNLLNSKISEIDLAEIDKISIGLDETTSVLKNISNSFLKEVNNIKNVTSNLNFIVKRINVIALVFSSVFFLSIGFTSGVYFSGDIVKTVLADDRIFLQNELKSKIESYNAKTFELDNKYNESSRLAKLLKNKNVELYFQDNDTFVSFPADLIDNKIYNSKNRKNYYIKIKSDIVD